MGGRQRTSADKEWGRDLQRINRLSQVAIIVGAFEDQLSRNQVASVDRLVPFESARERLSPLLQRSVLLRLVAEEPVVAHPVSRMVVAALLLVGKDLEGTPQRILRIGEILQLVGAGIRSAGIGRDGSDHAVLVQQVLLLFAGVGGPRLRLKEMVAAMIAYQGSLAYVASGMSKLVSPLWRDGVALSDSLRSKSYGNRLAYDLLISHPLLRRSCAWSVILSECLVPLAFVLPDRLRRIHLGFLEAMHVGIDVCMGLNRFLWAFSAFLISIDSCSRKRRASGHILWSRNAR